MIRDASEGRIYFNKRWEANAGFTPVQTPQKPSCLVRRAMGPQVGLMKQTKEMHKEDEKRNKNKNKILQDQEWLCEKSSNGLFAVCPALRLVALAERG